MLWVKVQEDRDEDDKLFCQQPDVEEMMGSKWPPFDTIRTNAITGAALGYHIHLCWCDDIPNDNENRNRAVAKVTDGLTRYPWRGPLVAFCGKPESDDEDADIVELYDMDMAAYSHVVAHLIDRYNTDPQYLAMKGPKIKAVEVLCDGEVRANGSERFRQVVIPRLHPFIRMEGEVSAISKTVGIPLVCMKYTTDQSPDYTNSVATAMLARLEPPWSNLGFGYPGFSWPKNLGNVLVFRKFFEPLEVDVVKAFAAYCKPVVRICQSAQNGKVKEVALAEITREKWEAFLAKWEGVRDAVAAKKEEVADAEGMEAGAEQEADRNDSAVSESAGSDAIWADPSSRPKGRTWAEVARVSKQSK